MKPLPAFLYFLLISVLGAGFFLFMTRENSLPIVTSNGDSSSTARLAVDLPPVPEANASSTPSSTASGTDEPKQSQLGEVPGVIKGIYLTGWIAGSDKLLAPLIKLVNDTSLNAVVIDVKDYSGYVSYKTGVPEIAKSGAENEIRIPHPNALLEKLHKNNIYAVARITVFQDSILSKSRPDLALKDSRGRAWKDAKGLEWMDPASREVWDYNIAIAKDALNRGFDEVNFDYVRFPSDGNLDAVQYPVWDKSKSRDQVIQEFFDYLRKELPDARISADLFGLATVSQDDLGIGQRIESAYPSFDAVMPMVYPSHYANGFMGYKNPADHPYDVVKYSMEQALVRRPADSRAKLRPWLQAFDLGAVYDKEKIQAQIKAVDDVLSGTDAYGGWVLWDPKNSYSTYKE